MLEYGSEKLEEARNELPNAAGLVIAPNIYTAEYMADILTQIEGERPVIVHSQTNNPENRIKGFRNSKQKWIVSVAMVSEGVDIKRLRVLVYLPYPRTELSFRQAMGRVVRTTGPDDMSSAYVVMPTLRIFEEYAKRVEDELVLYGNKPIEKSSTKVCPTCFHQNPRGNANCENCDEEFPQSAPRMRTCHDCGGLNPLNLEQCQVCGVNFDEEYIMTLNEAMRVGAIIRGMELTEEQVTESEILYPDIKEIILQSGDEVLISMLKEFPKESISRIVEIAEQVRKAT
ncbi:MAG: DEAD/DEAH box helicase [Candidatus Puniceispirillaceae bacterium]